MLLAARSFTSDPVRAYDASGVATEIPRRFPHDGRCRQAERHPADEVRRSWRLADQGPIGFSPAHPSSPPDFHACTDPSLDLIFLIETGQSLRGRSVMSVPQDFSRQFFADFIASRVKAWALGEGDSRPPSRFARAASKVDPSPARPDSTDPAAVEEPSGRIPGRRTASA